MNNNYNNINNQMQNFQKQMQNATAFLGKTPQNIKILFSIVLGFMPVFTFAFFFRSAPLILNPNTAYIEVGYGLMWVIALSTWIGSLAITKFAIVLNHKKGDKKLKNDLFISVTSYAWAAMGLMLMFYNGWARWLLMFVYYYAAALISRAILMMVMLRRQINIAKDMMSKVKQDPMYQQYAKSYSQQQDQMRAMMDEQLRQQGINIDELNEKFGDHLETPDDIAKDGKDVTIDIVTEEDKDKK